MFIAIKYADLKFNKLIYAFDLVTLIMLKIRTYQQYLYY